MRFLSLLFPVAILFLLSASGCIQPGIPGNEACAQVLTPAMGPKGDCVVFPTSCIPEGWSVVGSCESTVDLCADVACADKCEGTTYYGEGSCSEGECEYQSIQENSPSCSPEVDLCEGVTCHDRCENGTFYGTGSCFDGECSYDIVEPGSVKCSGLADLDLSVERKHCFYDPTFDKFSIFYQIKNLGETPVSPSASIWLVGEDVPGRKFHVINEPYTRNQVLWQERSITPYPYKGQEWEMRNLSTPQIIEYDLVYCDIDVFYDTCSVENGLVLDSGTTAGCPVNGWDLNAGKPFP